MYINVYRFLASKSTPGGEKLGRSEWAQRQI